MDIGFAIQLACAALLCAGLLWMYGIEPNRDDV